MAKYIIVRMSPWASASAHIIFTPKIATRTFAKNCRAKKLPTEGLQKLRRQARKDGNVPVAEECALLTHLD